MSVLDVERTKYRRMWELDAYRVYSPGIAVAPRAWDWLGIKPGQSLIDLGCGTGRAGAWFAERGVNVTLVDFVPEAVEHRELPFVEACLWDLPELRADYVFCTDVMEHIPPDRVDDVLDGMARITSAGFLQISTDYDVCGQLIGERLHLTVEPSSFWEAKLAERFVVVRTEQVGPNFCALVVKRA